MLHERITCLTCCGLFVLAGCSDRAEERLIDPPPPVNGEARVPAVEPAPDAGSPTDIPSYHGAIRARTEREFPIAAFIKPRASDVDPHLHGMAPLIVQEDASEEGVLPPSRRFGRLVPIAGAPPDVDTGEYAVYVSRAYVPLRQHELEQFAFVWFYPAPDEAAAPRWRGFRMTLSTAGAPLIWEVLSSDGDAQVYYVSEALESAATGVFGEPLPGRAFAIEPDIAAHPDVVVARLLADAPQPMGPYAYLDAGSLAVTTLLCRCMPAQVHDFSENTFYELIEIDERHREVFDILAGFGLILHGEPGELERTLRLPESS